MSRAMTCKNQICGKPEGCLRKDCNVPRAEKPARQEPSK